MNQHQNSFPRLASSVQVLRVAAVVPTCQRPRLLERCLDSIGGQVLEWNIDLQLVVVVNGEKLVGESLEVVERFRARYDRIPMHVVRVKERSISKARNAGMAKAVERGAQWIWFMDDDAQADPDCLGNLMSPVALRYPIVSGATLFSYPKPLPYWVADDVLPAQKSRDFEPAKHACTGNCRFSADLYRQGLRFDEAYGISGGEDFDFFGRAGRQGFQIRRLPSAISREELHAERLTWKMQMFKVYCEGSIGMRRLRAEQGLAVAIGRRGHSIVLDFVRGACLRAYAGLVKPLVAAGYVDETRYKRIAIKGGRRMAKAQGRFVGLFGIAPKSYGTVQGS